MRFVFALALVGCSSPTTPSLPGASITPSFLPRAASAACGVDSTWQGSRAPDVRTRFIYDEHGRLAQARTTYVRGGEDVMDYAWDNLDHMVQLVQTSGRDGARFEILAHYSTLGDLLEYSRTSAGSVERYVYDAYSETGNPTRQLAVQNGIETRLTFQYDARDRIILVTPDRGAPTVYSYDDDTRTTTLDTGNGAYHGVYVYDDRNREVSETWDGTDPSVIASQQEYEWDGDRLLAITYREGTKDAPHELRAVAVDTYRYDCASH